MPDVEIETAITDASSLKIGDYINYCVYLGEMPYYSGPVDLFFDTIDEDIIAGTYVDITDDPDNEILRAKALKSVQIRLRDDPKLAFDTAVQFREDLVENLYEEIRNGWKDDYKEVNWDNLHKDRKKDAITSLGLTAADVESLTTLWYNANINDWQLTEADVESAVIRFTQGSWGDTWNETEAIRHIEDWELAEACIDHSGDNLVSLASEIYDIRALDTEENKMLIGAFIVDVSQNKLSDDQILALWKIVERLTHSVSLELMREMYSLGYQRSEMVEELTKRHWKEDLAGVLVDYVMGNNHRLAKVAELRLKTALSFSEFIAKSLRNHRGYRGGHYSTEYEGDIFRFYRYGTMMIEVDFANRLLEVNRGYGSRSDRDSGSQVMGKLGVAEYEWNIDWVPIKGWKFADPAKQAELENKIKIQKVISKLVDSGMNFNEIKSKVKAEYTGVIGKEDITNLLSSAIRSKRRDIEETIKGKIETMFNEDLDITEVIRLIKEEYKGRGIRQDNIQSMFNHILSNKTQAKADEIIDSIIPEYLAQLESGSQVKDIAATLIKKNMDDAGLDMSTNPGVVLSNAVELIVTGDVASDATGFYVSLSEEGREKLTGMIREWIQFMISMGFQRSEISSALDLFGKQTKNMTTWDEDFDDILEKSMPFTYPSREVMIQAIIDNYNTMFNDPELTRDMTSSLATDTDESIKTDYKKLLSKKD